MTYTEAAVARAKRLAEGDTQLNELFGAFDVGIKATKAMIAQAIKVRQSRNPGEEVWDHTMDGPLYSRERRWIDKAFQKTMARWERKRPRMDRDDIDSAVETELNAILDEMGYNGPRFRQ